MLKLNWFHKCCALHIGWFPLYDTLQGIQGSLNVAVKLQYIGNDNPFRDSSAGVQFFSSSTLSPSEFLIQDVFGTSHGILL